MQRLRIWLRDWLRGYTDDDMRSLYAKLQQVHPPGGIIPLTNPEWAAYKAALGWK